MLRYVSPFVSPGQREMSKRGEPSIVEKLRLDASQQLAGDVAIHQSAVQDIRRDLEKIGPDSNAAAERHSLLGHAYVHLGEAASAIAEGEKSHGHGSTSKDRWNGPAIEEVIAANYAVFVSPKFHRLNVTTETAEVTKEEQAPNQMPFAALWLGQPAIANEFAELRRSARCMPARAAKLSLPQIMGN